MTSASWMSASRSVSALGVTVVGCPPCLGFEVDAFARAVLGSIDRIELVARWHDDTRVSRIGEHDVTVADVADAVLEHDEQVGATVDAQPGTGATVLIDPHPHHTTPEVSDSSMTSIRTASTLSALVMTFVTPDCHAEPLFGVQMALKLQLAVK